MDHRTDAMRYLSPLLDKGLPKNEFHFSIFRVANGYVLDNNSTYRGNTYDGKAKYAPDIDAILREVAFVIGGEDAVPVMPVSAEEAGLVGDDANQCALDLGTATSVGVLRSSEGTHAYHSSAVYEQAPELSNVGSLSTVRTEYSISALVDELRRNLRAQGANPVEATGRINAIFRKHGFSDFHQFTVGEVLPTVRYELGNDLERACQYGRPGTESPGNKHRST